MKDFDNDRCYVRRAGWKRAKAALREWGLPGLMLQLEELAQSRESCPRELLAVAIHHFLALSREQQTDALCSKFGLRRFNQADIARALAKMGARRVRSESPLLGTLICDGEWHRVEPIAATSANEARQNS